ncbi:hypothetical protein [Aliarcobacter cryaerophilus]|uniref:hypothetical protein n=1 Tax=Aliarcobacter cryaerophilus TaxID=28198 RepID=UPI00082510E3|nr:hypothetical protein [Aliarcobacter cryaerophilus]
MEKVTNREVSEMIGKEEQTIKGWSSKFPGLYSVVKLGAFCKKNGLSEEQIINLVNFKEKVKEEVEKINLIK